MLMALIYVLTICVAGAGKAPVGGGRQERGLLKAGVVYEA
jgi:hypothetical protein